MPQRASPRPVIPDVYSLDPCLRLQVCVEPVLDILQDGGPALGVVHRLPEAGGVDHCQRELHAILHQDSEVAIIHWILYLGGDHLNSNNESLKFHPTCDEPPPGGSAQIPVPALPLRAPWRPDDDDNDNNDHDGNNDDYRITISKRMITTSE